MIRFLLLLLFLPLYSQQEDLLDLLDDEKIKTEYVEASFKGTRVVNAQSLEIPKSKILQFMIQKLMILKRCLLIHLWFLKMGQ